MQDFNIWRLMQLHVFTEPFTMGRMWSGVRLFGKVCLDGLNSVFLLLDWLPN